MYPNSSQERNKILGGKEQVVEPSMFEPNKGDNAKLVTIQRKIQG